MITAVLDEFHMSGPRPGSGLCLAWSLPASLDPLVTLTFVSTTPTESQLFIGHWDTARSSFFPAPQGALALGPKQELLLLLRS